MIVCKKCGAQCPDGNIFCEVCGAELEVGVLPENVDEKGRMKNPSDKNKKKKKLFSKRSAAADSEAAETKQKRERSPERKAEFKKKLRAGAICIAVVAVILIIVWLVSLSEANKGLKAAQNIPLGRNVEYAASDTGLTFMEKSDNGIVDSMADFDYVCVSEETVKVSGSEQPEWAVMLYVGDDGLITEVDYYDFSQLKYNWKGRKMAEMLTQDSVAYGMPINSITKQFGFKPYYISRNVNNDSVYCYRYYYYDEETYCDRAFNYLVEFSDVDNTVKNVYYEEIDYAGVILSARADTEDEAVAEYDYNEDEISADEDGEEIVDENTD